jgi:hypothetical protein
MLAISTIRTFRVICASLVLALVSLGMATSASAAAPMAMHHCEMASDMNMSGANMDCCDDQSCPDDMDCASHCMMQVMAGATFLMPSALRFPSASGQTGSIQNQRQLGTILALDAPPPRLSTI